MFRAMAGFAAKVRGRTLNLSTPGNCHSDILREPEARPRTARTLRRAR